MLTGALACLLIILFLILEGRARLGQTAKSLERSAEDRGSTTLLGAVHGVSMLALLLSLGLDYFGIAIVSWASILGWVGLVLELTGIGIRFWANRVLGEYYTRTLRVTDTQTVIRHGPYSKIRHPGYLGAITMWLGAALATMNGLAIVLVPLCMVAAYSYRIRAEEAMLAQKIGEPYRAYQQTTWRLIPFIY